jgi:hypothetical protein
MKKAETEQEGSDMRGQYDFSGGVRGKYAHRFADRSTVVLLEPDVAEVFPDAASVNETLRKLIVERASRPGR